MSLPQPNAHPKTLAENLGAGGSSCPIPSTHDRLREVHHWWHEMARGYHEPDPFRYALGAFIQAARNVTWMLQKEQSVFPNFSWYREWSERAKSDILLRWLNDARTDFVKRQALAPKSLLQMRCIDNPRQKNCSDDDEDSDGSYTFKVNPFECTHFYIGMGPWGDHAHEFGRHWEVDGLAVELLEACAGIYDLLDGLISDAHRRLGAQVKSYQTGRSGRALPCMEDTTKHRVIRTVVRDGREVWKNELLLT
jgi:hypothetical protein